MKNESFTVNSIGQIKAAEGKYTLQLKPEHAAALTGLQGFSHVNVLWWCHLYDDYREISIIDKPYVNGPEQIGIFATRSPVRPNPIAITTVSVADLDIDAGEVTLDYIDAENGTPILDIKPYYPCEDRVRTVSTPEWNAHWPQYVEDNADFDWDAEFVIPQ